MYKEAEWAVVSQAQEMVAEAFEKTFRQSPDELKVTHEMRGGVITFYLQSNCNLVQDRFMNAIRGRIHEFGFAPCNGAALKDDVHGSELLVRIFSRDESGSQYRNLVPDDWIKRG